MLVVVVVDELDLLRQALEEQVVVETVAIVQMVALVLLIRAAAAVVELFMAHQQFIRAAQAAQASSFSNINKFTML
jgi:hypothetical protein